MASLTEAASQMTVTCPLCKSGGVIHSIVLVKLMPFVVDPDDQTMTTHLGLCDRTASFVHQYQAAVAGCEDDDEDDYAESE